MQGFKRSLLLAGINETRLRGMLGFAMRAGKLIIGTESVCRAMAQDTVKLVLVSFAASDGAKKKIKTKSEFYNLDCFELPIVAASLGNLI